MPILKPCPCGKTPQSLHIVDNGSKWAYVSGNCCNAWNIEFRTQYHRIETAECMALAFEAWNEAERGSLLTKRAPDRLTALALIVSGLINMVLLTLLLMGGGR